MKQEDAIHLSPDDDKILKDDVLPHFLQKYTARKNIFTTLTDQDFRLLEELFHRAAGRPLGYTLTKSTEFVKKVNITSYYH